MSEHTKSRNSAFDIGKGLAILCVFYGHFVSTTDLSTQFVYRFHLPYFFFVSGYYFKQCSKADATHRVLYSYYIPFVFFWALTFVCMLLFSYEFGFYKTVVHHFHPRALIETFVYGEPKFNRSLWFLYSLCLVYLVTLIWEKFAKRRLLARALLPFVALLFAVVVDAIGFSNKEFLPLHIESVPAGLFFYSMGSLFGVGLLSVRSKLPKVVSLLLAIVIFMLLAARVSPTEIVNMHCGRFSPTVYFDSIMGIVAIILLGDFLTTIPFVSCFLSHVGRKSLVYFACEASLGHLFLDSTLFKIFGTPNNASIMIGACVAVARVFVIFPFVGLIENFLGYVKGQANSFNESKIGA